MNFIKRHSFFYLTIAMAVCVAAVFCANIYTSAMSVADAASGPITVIIDAGHGGEDGGAVSKDGVQESQLNLEIALRLNDLLHLLGKETRMIRQEDVSVYSDGASTLSEKKVSDLKNRVEIVNSIPNALLISIHQNMFQESQYHGAQVFYAPTGGSQSLAESLQALIAMSLDPSNHRAAKPAETVYLMNNISCPGVLVECGFLSNAEERSKLCTPEYQRQISVVLAKGIVDYIETASTNEV